MSVYLKVNPPVRSQFYTTRSKDPTGCVVVHTTENGLSTSARNVAGFIARRADAGSYHDIVDTGGVVHVGEYGWTMFSVRGHNSYTLNLAFVARHNAWGSYDPQAVSALLRNGVAAAVRMNAWLVLEHGRTIRARRITKAQAEAGESGFTDHARLDPSRRKDPGGGFPWDLFLSMYAAAAGVPLEHNVTVEAPAVGATVAGLQAELNALGWTPALKVDDQYGPKTAAAVTHHLGRSAVLGEVESVIAGD